MKPFIADSAIKAMLEREEKLYVQRNPKSQALSLTASKHWLSGVPMHWMVDWGLPFALLGSRIQLALIKTVLTEFFTDKVFQALIVLAKRLERGIADVIIKYSAPWQVSRVGARVEFICRKVPPRSGVASLSTLPGCGDHTLS